MRLQFEGIRCFSAAQDAIIRPLTILVGENSSGKSTFLALCQIAASITNGFAQEFPFNEPPFLLGACGACQVLFDRVSCRGRSGQRVDPGRVCIQGRSALAQHMEASRRNLGLAGND